VFGIGHYLRPHMVQFISCTNVLFAGYQTTNTAFWQHNPVNCRNLHVKGIYANSMGPNSDGFDPESCSQVLIEDCQFNTGDDCIAIDSGKGTDIQYGPAENIVIQNCRMQSGHGALTLGSIMAGGIQNVFAQNLVFENVNWKTDPLNIAIRLKTSMNRGGFLRNFYVRDVSIPNGIRTTPAFYTPPPGSSIPARTVAAGAGAIITFDCDYDAVNDNIRTRPPVVTNVHISRVTVGDVATKDGRFSCYQPVVILGPVAANYNGVGKPPILPVSGVTISDCDFGTPVNAAQPVYLYNAKGVVLRNVTIGGKRQPDAVELKGGRLLSARSSAASVPYPRRWCGSVSRWASRRWRAATDQRLGRRQRDCRMLPKHDFFNGYGAAAPGRRRGKAPPVPCRRPFRAGRPWRGTAPARASGWAEPAAEEGPCGWPVRRR
jgi:polygalacturonase